MNNIFLGFGSNLGQREQNIEDALFHLTGDHKMALVQQSKLYETVAVSSYQQPNYINAVMQMTTLLFPHDLIQLTELVEKKMGRTTKGLGDPRIIDIDILFFNSEIISTDGLTIPHAFAHERLFVLNPMNDIAPTYKHPVFNMSIADLRAQLNGY
jgi:2-amino-4-hydroxy-6-hydroxymethyldihydropteridine diphosphokinase